MTIVGRRRLKYPPDYGLLDARRPCARVNRLPFEDRRTHVADCRVAAALVIEHLDVIKQRHLRLPATLKAIREFAFERFDPTNKVGMILISDLQNTSVTAKVAFPLYLSRTLDWARRSPE